jgi:hypothetical protein
MLSKLGVLARAADYIDLTDPDGNLRLHNIYMSFMSSYGTLIISIYLYVFVVVYDVMDGVEKKPAGDEETKIGDMKGKGPKFGHLHVCFRDFSFDGDRMVRYHIISYMPFPLHYINTDNVCPSPICYLIECI